LFNEVVYFFYFRSAKEEVVEIDNLNIRMLPEVGTRKGMLLEQELGIRTFEDMLYHIPYRYVDRSHFYTIAELTPSLPYIQVKAKISRFTTLGEGAQKRAVAIADDGTGELELIWFKGYKYLAGLFVPDKEYVIFGKPTLFNRRVNIVHPEVDVFEGHTKQLIGFQALYSTTEKMKRGYLNSKAISNIQAAIFRRLHERITETLPAWFIRKYHLLYLHDALYNIHFPESPERLREAQFRLKFEELFYIQLHILKLKFKRKTYFRGHPFTVVGEYFNRFYAHHLPFLLTDAQKRVIREIRQDCGSGKQMNRLLQGDVGSGKTLVAVMCMLLALDNGFQACIMAPTEILAAQHRETISGLLREMSINIGLLTGSTKKRERAAVHEALVSGELQILIGTHALLEDVVNFHDLGLVVIDEQHRFGVAQRAKLWQKSAIAPHMLVMTATPIPRTLAMTLYGELDLSVIDQLPPGRKPVTTYHVYDARRLDTYAFIRTELEKGRQVYVVYPLISGSETMDYRDLEEGYTHINDYFAPLGYRAGIVHGQLKATEKEEQMRQFVSGEIQILVATTVIEVGVNVPNASVMLIESAERFGLSQLHQLRGRVGRGADQSYCILMTSYKLSADSRKRIDTMTSTNDGFEIAEVDMKLRGPGDIEGTQQSGLTCNLRVADLGRDELILNQAVRAATEILERDPDLANEENALFAVQVKRLFMSRMNWRYIS
jgi:ATP-dependent DNA helicase RecG